jgi:hypothetical protein
VVAWELLTGQVPFEETDTPVAVLYRHVHEPIPSVRTVVPEIDQGIAAWLERMLAKRPEDRYQSADDAWLELEDIVLELLGPRWRREARLIVDDHRRQDRTLTPAEFPAVGPPPMTEDPPAPAPAPVAETVTGPPAQEPEATVAPRRKPVRSYTTILRNARRHRDLGPDDQAAGTTLRRRMWVATIVVAMLAAAAGGVVLAESVGMKKAPRTGTAQAVRQAAQQATTDQATATTKQLAATVQSLAVARNRALTGLLNAKTPTRQATDAAAIEHAYVDAAQKVAPLAATSPAAGKLSATLTSTAAAYGRLAAAARTHNTKAYDHARSDIRSAEHTLQGEVSKL